MSTSSSDTVFGLGTTCVVVPPGATQAVYITQAAGQNSTLLKYRSGGSLLIIGCAAGATLSAADLGANHASHYLMGITEALALDGPVSCYLAAIGATTIVDRLVGRSAGF